MGALDYQPSVDYADAWQYFDDIEGATFLVGAGPVIGVSERPTNQPCKVRRESIESRDFRVFANAFGLGATDCVMKLWPADGATIRDIEPADEVLISGVRWIVQNAMPPKRSYWLISARKKPTNA